MSDSLRDALDADTVRGIREILDELNAGWQSDGRTATARERFWATEVAK